MTVSGLAAPAAPDRSSEKDTLRRIQASVKDKLDQVTDEMASSVLSDAPLLARMGQHLMAMRGKMFRPTLVLL